MGAKRIIGRLLALLILGGALIFGMSGVYHEAPWIVSPLFGSAKIRFAGRSVSVYTTTLKAEITKRDIPLLESFPNLKSADFRDSECYEEIAQWADLHPEVDVLYKVRLPNGDRLESSAQEVDLTWMNPEDVPATQDALACLRKLRLMRFGEVGGRISVSDMQQVHDVWPDTECQFSAVIGGKVYDGAATSLDLRDARHEDAQALAMVLSCMKKLTFVELGSEDSGSIPWADIALWKDNCRDVQFRYSFTLYGRRVDLDTETLDYRGIPIRDNGNALFSVLSCMNHCTLVDLDSTGIADSSLEELRSRFPDTKIIWRVWFGENYSVRTDVEKILASKPTVGGMISDASVLRYCTEVKYLDLGHNDELRDLSFVSAMPKLEVLIIAMTAITDISPLQNCPKLEYVEFNSTNIADLTPLQGCTGIHHLNIAGCPKIRDITPLYGMTELERLWIGRDTPVPAEQVQRMREIVPACKINTTTDDPHGDAWRFTDYDPEIPKYYWVPRYELLREQMGYNYQEYSFYWLDPYCDKEVPDEYRGMFGKEVYGL